MRSRKLSHTQTSVPQGTLNKTMRMCQLHQLTEKNAVFFVEVHNCIIRGSSYTQYSVLANLNLTS